MLQFLKNIRNIKNTTTSVLAHSVLVDHSLGLLVYTTAKCGSGSTKEWFLALEGIISENDIDNRRADKVLGMNIHEYFRGPGRSFCPKTTELPEFERRYRKIVVARNPYSRLVSFYAEKVLKQENRLDSLGTNRRIPYATDITFRELITQIAEIPDNEIDQHLRSQTHSRVHLTFDRVVRIEQFQRDIDELSSTMGITRLRCAPHRNPTTYSDQIELPVCDWRPEEFRGHNPPSYRHFFDDDLQRQVGERYKSDIEILGYDF